MSIAISKTQGASHSPNISLGVPFAYGSFHPNFCFAETILNNKCTHTVHCCIKGSFLILNQKIYKGYYPNYPMEIIRNNLKAKGLTNSTIKTYSSILGKFFEHTKKVNSFTEEEINNYLNYLMIKKNYSGRSRNLVMKIIRYYCREFLGLNINLKKAKETKPIPKICEDNEFNQIISVTPNIKHRLCLCLMRYSGLRRYEVIRVMKHHIQPDGRLLVKEGKGMKDRMTIIPPQVLEDLRKFIDLLPVDNLYVFQGVGGKGHYNKRTPQKILINAFKKLGWKKERWFSPHSLRHSFCVWALENDIGDYDEVSKMLGHSVTQTTQIYTQCRRLNLLNSINKCKELVICT